MKASEIVRRARALLALAPDERPVSVQRLEKIAGVADDTLYDVARTGSMQAKTRVRLARAFTLVENDQIRIRQGNRKSIYPAERVDVVTLVSPRRPMETIMRLAFTKDGPKVRFEAVNPLAFPKLDKLER